MKKILWTLGVIAVLVGLYFFLGYFGVVPTYHCDSALGPNGVVNFCEWYSGGDRVY